MLFTESTSLTFQSLSPPLRFSQKIAFLYCYSGYQVFLINSFYFALLVGIKRLVKSVSKVIISKVKIRIKFKS